MPHALQPAAMRNLALRLLTLAQGDAAIQHDSAVTIVIDRLRVTLIKFAGVESFLLLLRRSIALARDELPGLGHVTVNAEGRLHGLDRNGFGESLVAESAVQEASVVVLANLLSLLSTFIGAPFTIRLVQNAWPSVALTPSPTSTEKEV